MTNRKLTVNAMPNGFESKLKPGINGPYNLANELIVDNVVSVDIEQMSDYQDNMDGHYVVTFKNGDQIIFDGCTGLWALETYDYLSNELKQTALNDFKTVLLYWICEARQ